MHLSFGIIGGGPAGFYTARQLFKIYPDCKIDIYEKLPVPFGLLRYGVAPDHQKIKRVQQDLSEIAENKQFNFNYYGNVDIGRQIPTEELKQFYSAIIFAYGTQGDKKLGLENENQINKLYSSRQIVNWYNKYPNDINNNKENIQNFNLKDEETIGLIGNGNVSIDIMRILAKKNEELMDTDINEQALEDKNKSKIRNMIVFGRRGLMQSAFTVKEIRELYNVKNLSFHLYKPDLERSLNHQSIQELEARDLQLSRVVKRKLEFCQQFNILQNKDELKSVIDNKKDQINIIFRYMVSPVQLKNEGQKIRMDLVENELEGESFKQRSKYKRGSQLEEITVDMLVKSIGYGSTQIDHTINFDHKELLIRNNYGCVQKHGDPSQIEVGKYVVGWVKTGAQGIVDTTFKNAEETVNNIRVHVISEYVKQIGVTQETIEQYLRDKNVSWIDFNGWKRINKYEILQGEKKGKIRDKINGVEEMIKVGRG